MCGNGGLRNALDIRVGLYSGVNMTGKMCHIAEFKFGSGAWMWVYERELAKELFNVHV